MEKDLASAAAASVASQSSSEATSPAPSPADHHDHIKCSILEDGRLNLNFDEKLQRLFERRGSSLFHQQVEVQSVLKEHERKPDKHMMVRAKNTPFYRKETYSPVNSDANVVPRMNVAILITGSRGDVQPFIALGQRLKKLYNHRVRICTHPTFKNFVEENGLEYYSIGGDPAKLMAYMVKNPGILPSKESRKAGDVGQRRAEIEEMLHGAWRACTMAGDGVTYPVTAAHPAHYHEPFVADALISNPPTYASLHIAEKLAIPLHMMFTMPWSPTTAFPHPLANLDAAKVDAKVANYMSYSKIELLTWEGLQDLINRFREQTLGLDPISPTWGYLLLARLKVPYTYCWSQALIPKPADWGPHIDISGFFFLPLASNYKPDPELQAFLEGGPPPIYIGFGSIVIDDPDKLTRMIFEAVERAGARAIISKGWANIGKNPPPNCHVIDNVPHDWLFTKVAAVCHHGGAGTTAAGLALGRPTIIIPFFGDQPFWGGMVARAGAGPVPVPYKELTTEKLTECIKTALAPTTLAKAREMSAKMKGEDGVQTASESFQRSLNAKAVACFILPDRVAVWRIRKTNILLSSTAAGLLVRAGKLNPGRLKLLQKKEWLLSEGAQAPITALIGTVSGLGLGIATDVVDYKRAHRSEKLMKSATGKSTTPPAIDEKTELLSPTPEGAALGAAMTAGKTQTRTHSPGEDLERNRTFQRNKYNTAGGTLAANIGAHAGRAPVAFFYNMANGFHNAPEFLLADGSVRKRGQVDDLKSGIRVAGKEFVMNVWDGFSGLVRCPYDGFVGTYSEDDLVTVMPCHAPKAKSSRTAVDKINGLGLGVVRGVLGLPLKLGAAAFAIPGFTLKGIEKEIQKRQDGVAEHQGRIEHGTVQKRIGEMSEKTVTEQDLQWMASDDLISRNPVVDARVWQSHREAKAARTEMGEAGRELERRILDAWEKLNVDAKLVGESIKIVD